MDFNKTASMACPGMNNGAGVMSARMNNDENDRIICGNCMASYPAEAVGRREFHG